MITSVTIHKCKKCESTNVVKNGHNACGSPLYKCKDCNAHGVLISKRSTANIDEEALERTYLERNSYRSTGRIFKISHVTVMNKIKKKSNP
jgi:insertion element IS1 protein InsB